MTSKYLVKEIAGPGYTIERGLYDNPKEAQKRAMELFVLEFIPEENLKIIEVQL